MSPFWIERERCLSGVKTTVTKQAEGNSSEGPKSFAVSPIEAARILGVPKSTLLYRVKRLGLETKIERKKSRGKAGRVFDDELLLELARKFPETEIEGGPDWGSGYTTVIKSDSARAILNIPWDGTYKPKDQIGS